MILDLLDNAQLYRGLGSRFAHGLDWLRAFDPKTPVGRIAIEGDDLYAMIQAYDTKPAHEKKFESHRTYADIQFVVSGQEIMGYCPLPNLAVVTQPYEAKGDCALYADPKRATDLVLSPGMFAIFWPEDGHKPGCALGPASRVQKVVLKVRL
jgi:YhcH/YjgK/YiaL family protein